MFFFFGKSFGRGGRHGDQPEGAEGGEHEQGGVEQQEVEKVEGQYHE